MELFEKLFGQLLLFVYHCFDRIVINGYLSGLSRPEQVVHFFRQVIGVPILSKEVIAQRTNDYQKWVQAFAQTQMARELGMNPRKLGVLARGRQEPWKLPLPEFIGKCYRKSFGRSEPEHVKSLEEVVQAEERRRKEKQARKAKQIVNPAGLGLFDG